ncbi:host-nuclease inhibitor Gam family protein [Vulcaniibacterium tengchongense]|uniref:Phage host-nuclease inhibitor protein Gam n=1 Tax=Vulcaniibacterium tengchongense TaxID=1273429 RepID=A0A3N4W9A5_9GAMM|nr:host-nuclease inhibitor Gam family protein [Vulcaniibacterium tengchongense]RPE81824.1 phage host-nuclease inhibitor protein Gam [Vulcaniibacterium tengchongense]
MSSKKTRIKTEAAVVTLRDQHEVDAALAEIGAAQRARQSIETEMNAKLAEIKEHYEALAAPHAAVIAQLGEGVRIWCEARRAELTKDGRTKTAKFGAGEVSWRMRPPSVNVRSEGIVIETLKKLGLERFIRTKESVNKEAILAEPSAVEGIKGLSVVTGKEDFVIKPFATEIEEVR